MLDIYVIKCLIGDGFGDPAEYVRNGTTANASMTDNVFAAKQFTHEQAVAWLKGYEDTYEAVSIAQFFGIHGEKKLKKYKVMVRRTERWEKEVEIEAECGREALRYIRADFANRGWNAMPGEERLVNTEIFVSNTVIFPRT